jgi:hypothetical protein
VHPKVSVLAACSENYKWYSHLPLGVVVSLFCESVVSFATITLCVASQRVFVVVVISLSTQSRNFFIHPRIKNLALFILLLCELCLLTVNFRVLICTGTSVCIILLMGQ